MTTTPTTSSSRSSRPAARSLKNIGLGCLVAHSLNGLFYRNCINFAFPALECPGVQDLFEEGDTAEVDFEAAAVRNVTRNKSLAGRPTPPQLLDGMVAQQLLQPRRGGSHDIERIPALGV